MPKNILLIEDDKLFHDLLKEELTGSFYVESAYTINEAMDKLKNLEKYDAVLLDGCVPGDTLNTVPLIKYIIGEKYKKPIIAISSYPEYRKEMLLFGCTHESPKEDVAHLLNGLYC